MDEVARECACCEADLTGLDDTDVIQVGDNFFCDEECRNIYYEEEE